MSGNRKDQWNNMVEKTKKAYLKLCDRINNSGVIEEKDILRIKKQLSDDYSNMEEILDSNNFSYFYKVSLIQSKKGKEYLIKKYLTKSGNDRKIALKLDDDFKALIKKLYNGSDYSFNFTGFKDITNGFFHFYAPIYELVIDNKSFSYFHYDNFDYPEYECRINDFIYAY